jgi:hypothetical protein
VIGGQLRRVALYGTVAIGLGIAVGFGPVSGRMPTPVSAQEAPTVPSPPPGAGVVFESALTGSDVFATGTCRTGLARGENVGEGFRLKVSGRCVDESSDADLAVPGRGITIGDGELALDFKVASGGARARVSVYVRNKDRRLIGAHIKPGTGETALFSTVEGNSTVLATANAGELLKPTDWNRAAVRVSGHELWLLLNEEPVLYASDVNDVAGGVGIWLFREGNPDDEDEAAVIFRGLTLSAVADAEPARKPTYSAP